MTGIERHFEEERQARQLLFRQKLLALRQEFADLELLYVEPLGPADVIEIYPNPEEIIPRKVTRTRWSWS